MSKDEALGPLRVLRQRLQELVAKHGLDLHVFGVTPGDENQPDLVQTVLVLTPRAAEGPVSAETQAEIDSLNALLGSESADVPASENPELVQQKKDRETLRDWLTGPS